LFIDANGLLRGLTRYGLQCHAELFLYSCTYRLKKMRNAFRSFVVSNSRLNFESICMTRTFQPVYVHSVTVVHFSVLSKNTTPCLNTEPITLARCRYDFHSQCRFVNCQCHSRYTRNYGLLHISV